MSHMGYESFRMINSTDSDNYVGWTGWLNLASVKQWNDVIISLK